MEEKEVFICCAPDDYSLAEYIRLKLDYYHIGSVIANSDHLSDNHLNGLSVFVLLFSSNAAKSPIVDNLLSEAFSMRMRILPFNVDGSSITNDPTWDFQLRKSQWVLGYPDREKQIDNLIVSVCRFLGIDAIQESPTDPFEQLKRGIALEYGTNFLERNRKEAMLWLTKAAEQGNLHAMIELYRFYDNSEDGNPYTDYKTALEWLKRASDGGHAEAQYIIATQYDVLDEDTRVKYLESSYSKGNKHAAFALAKMLMGGKNDDKLKIFSLVNEASVLNDNVIWNTLGEFYRDGVGTEVDYAKAVDCFKKANWFGTYNLAMAYYEGKGVEQDYDKAYEMFAGNTFGDPRYFFMAGECLENGRGVQKDDRKAAEAYKKAHEWYSANGNSYYSLDMAHIALERAARIDSVSQFTLGKKHFDNEEYTKALRCFESAANNGLPIAMFYYGALFYYGLGTSIDEKIALIWLKKADIPGMPEATTLLGDIYYDGQGIESDEKKAIEYYTRAAYQNYPEAERKLSEILIDPEKAKYWAERAKKDDKGKS